MPVLLLFMLHWSSNVDSSVRPVQVPEVQLHEPSLCLTAAVEDQRPCEHAYKTLSGSGVPINLVTYYDDIAEVYQWVVKLPVSAISLDFIGQVLLMLASWNLQQAPSLCVLSPLVDAPPVCQNTCMHSCGLFLVPSCRLLMVSFSVC